MLAKAALVLLIAAFGALMFVAGAVAPEALRRTIGAHAERLAALARRIAPALAGDTPQKAAAPAAGKEALPIAKLLVPTPAPAKGRYALQLGQFATAAEAESRAKEAIARGIASTVLAVVDGAGQSSSVVAGGVYGSADDARAARRGVPPELVRPVPPENVPVILLPAPETKAPDTKAGS